ncbi:hypothetical protein FVE85_0119 [Porphyridium purpureum]|uniref:Uncharacterized protein n=1 Tax=Porphyridium purpureum TaxID=35688 RepID=A0A5J4YZG9_PORPP|nr:hypothetical protein FVE85_0119 [Porphyridium purpureum]|eukprot:POR3064..scf208_2
MASGSRSLRDGVSNEQDLNGKVPGTDARHFARPESSEGARASQAAPMPLQSSNSAGRAVAESPPAFLRRTSSRAEELERLRSKLVASRKPVSDGSVHVADVQKAPNGISGDDAPHTEAPRL